MVVGLSVAKEDFTQRKDLVTIAACHFLQSVCIQQN
jgi:hypothetical protein